MQRWAWNCTGDGKTKTPAEPSLALPIAGMGWKFFFAKGSCRNKFRILGVEAPVWQGAQVQAYRDISAPIVTLGQQSQAGCIGA
jgi:hypothetical protein